MGSTPQHDQPPELKRFVVSVALFLLPLLLGSAVLLWLPRPRAFAAYHLRDNCMGSALWIHSRVYAVDAPIDVALFGTSRMLTGANDAAIEAALAARGRPRRVVNFAYPWNGRNLHYILARDLLETREVASLVVEVSYEEYRRSHPVFGYLADADDLVGATLRYDLRYFEDLYKGLHVRLNHARHRMLGLPWTGADPAAPLHRPRIWGGGTLSQEQLRAQLAANRARWRDPGSGPPAWRDRLPRRYIRDLGALAARHGTRLHFAFTPAHGEPAGPMREEQLYRELGDVWRPPRAILDDEANWDDPHHLNDRGRALLSAWLAEQLAAVE